MQLEEVISMRRLFIDDGRWQFTLTIASGGLLAWVPCAHAARELEDRRPTRRANIHLAVSIAIIGCSVGLASLPPLESENTGGVVFWLITGLTALLLSAP